MKNMPRLFLALFVASVSSAALADDTTNESINVHFTGKVTQPTCGFTSPNLEVPLDPIKASDLEKVTVGQATDTSDKRFELKVQCASRAEDSHISIALQATADSTSPNAIANTADSQDGVGLELFTEGGQALALNSDLPSNSYIDHLNAGEDNLDFVVKYTRLKDSVSGGDVAGNAIFVVNYK